MRRSTVLLAGVLLAGCAPPVSVRSPEAVGGPMRYTPSAPSERELLPDEQIQQALNRLAFGARPGDAAKVRAIGVDAWIQQQLHPETIPDDAGQKELAQFPALSLPTDELFRTFQGLQQARNQQQKQLAQIGDTVARKAAQQSMLASDPKMAADMQREQRLVPELQTAMLARAVVSERQLDEEMVNFWENHFNVFAAKGPQERIFLPAYDRDVIRPNAMGKFRTLLGAVAHSPAMLFYLDNWESVADSVHPTLTGPQAFGRGGRGFPPPRPGQPPRPARRGLNENYARELMELHTLGVDGGYTQKDVIEVARALSGWSIAIGQGGQFIFRPESHDAGPKTILGQNFPGGQGEEEGERVLDLVASHPSTAKFITTKLARYFVSDDPPADLVDRCAVIFRQTDGDIRQTVGCIVTSREFFSRAAYRAKVKSPFQVVASAFRAVQAVPDTTPRSTNFVTQLGQPIFGHQTPDGWPDRGDAWMNSGAILNRINFGLVLASGRMPGVTMQPVPELEQLKTASRDAQVDGVVKLFFGGQVSTDTRDVLLSGANPLQATLKPDSSSMGMNATGRGGGGRGGRGGFPGQNQPVALQGLAQIVGLALGAPEFQRR